MKEQLYIGDPQDTLAPPDYNINRCFPNFLDGRYRSRFKEALGLDNISTLSLGVFKWLLAYVLVTSYTDKITCSISLVRLHAIICGEPEQRLGYQGNLYEGARGWFHFVVGKTGTKFALSQKSPVLHCA